jgi:hypothetical protein
VDWGEREEADWEKWRTLAAVDESRAECRILLNHFSTFQITWQLAAHVTLLPFLPDDDG